MKVNWIVRIKNKAFWLAIIPAVLLLVKQIAIIFGYDFDFSVITNQLLAVVETVFVILAILGIVNDPTTKSLSDSEQALTYLDPKE